MNIGSSTNDFAWNIIIGLGILASLPVLTFLILGIGRILSAVIPIDRGWLTLILLFLTFGGLLFGGSYYLDTAGQPAVGQVVDKQERVQLQQQGDWRHAFSASVQYPLNGETANAGLSVPQKQYDELKKGESAELELLPIWRTVAVTRLTTINTLDYLPLRWIAIVAGAIFLFVWGTRPQSKIGCGILAMISAVALIALPIWWTYHSWQSAENIASRPLRAQVTVEKITRIDHINYFPCYPGGNRSCESRINTGFDTPQQYDIVQMRFVPQGWSEEVLAVDSADAGSLALREGAVVSIGYSADNPRDAQLIGATHHHHWRNAIYFVGIMVVSFGIIILFGVIWGRLRPAAPTI